MTAARSDDGLHDRRRGCNGARDVPAAHDGTVYPHALIAGATGLVGATASTRCWRRPQYAGVTALVRRPCAQRPADWTCAWWRSISSRGRCRRRNGCVLCARDHDRRRRLARGVQAVDLGSRQRRSRGSRATAVRAASCWCPRSAPIPDASNFYLRVKGQAERAVGGDRVRAAGHPQARAPDGRAQRIAPGRGAGPAPDAAHVVRPWWARSEVPSHLGGRRRRRRWSEQPLLTTAGVLCARVRSHPQHGQIASELPGAGAE